ncbi:Conserved_hypothetical protein [Hexamita inflata]|uniref:Uncharacterized protein n=1 Tax=Hexamita inflata TaxID=28002 RepID=A0AA86R1V8_9EUKA|nr:Conserved hypothetical protein [Hexamita inflata]
MTQRFISTNKSVGKLSFEEQLQTMVNFVKNTLNPPKHKFWDIVSQKLGVPVSQCVLKYNELIQKEEAPDLRPIPKKLSNNLLQYDTSLITQSTSQTITVRVTDGFQVESMQLPRLLLLEIPLLRDIMKTGNSFELNLNCNIQIFKMIITYLETGNLNIDDYNADELFRLSRYLQMVQLQALALDFTSSKNSQTQIELQQDHYDHIIRNNQSPFSISNTFLQKQLFQLALVRFQRLRFLTCKRCQISYPELLKTHFNDNCSHDFQADANPTTNFDRQMTLLRKRRCNYFELLLCFMSCCSVVLVNDKQYILIDLVNGVNVQTNYDHITDKLQVMNIQQELVNINLTPTLLYQILKDNFENVFLQKMIIQTQTQKNTKIEAFQMSYKPRSRIKQKAKEEFVVVNTQQKEEDGFQVINRDLFPMKETEATNKTEVDISQAVIAQIVHEMDLFV